METQTIYLIRAIKHSDDPFFFPKWHISPLCSFVCWWCTASLEDIVFNTKPHKFTSWGASLADISLALSLTGTGCLLVNVSFLSRPRAQPETSEQLWNWMQSTVSLGVFMQSGSEQAEVRWCQWRVKSAGWIDTRMTDTCKIHSRLRERRIICLALHKTLSNTAEGSLPPSPPRYEERNPVWS